MRLGRMGMGRVVLARTAIDGSACRSQSPGVHRVALGSEQPVAHQSILSNGSMPVTLRSTPEGPADVTNE
jgi:hypothetical protein